MFLFSITMEDGHIVARSEDGVSGYECTSTDQHTGKSRAFKATNEQLTAILTLMIHPDGMPPNVDECYAAIGTLFDGWETELRPVP